MGQSCISKTLGKKGEEDTAEVVVLENESELKEGEMKEVKAEVNGSEKAVTCLLVRHKGTIRALSSKCTHYGAPLIKGSFDNEAGTIRCPFHGACFNVASGDIEDFPGLDNLFSYPVFVDQETKTVKIKIAKNLAGQIRRVYSPKKTNQSAPNTSVVVIVGGGGAAETCLETLRGPTCEFEGKIVVVSKDKCIPYDRPKLSKAMNADPDSIALRSSKYYEERDIELKLDSTVSSLDVPGKKIFLEDGSEIAYDKLVLASGTTPRTLNIPGSNLKNIFVLRTPEDANGIARPAESLAEKNVVIIGASFIGTEVAAFLVGKAAGVTIVSPSKVPFARTLGPEIGKYIQSLHEDKGVKFVSDTKPVEFKANDGGDPDRVGSVICEDGRILSADIVVLGVGVVSTTKYLKNSGVTLDNRGYIMVNEKMETNVPDIYAAGDVVNFPLFTHNHERYVIGHWQMAKAHGRNAALNLCGKTTNLRSVPFFWTMQFGKSIRVAGFADSYDEIVYDGLVSDGVFIAYYVKGDEVVSVATLGRDPIAAKFADRLKLGKKLKKDEIPTWLSA